MMLDYSEQILMTCVKQDRHCFICIVSSSERDNLMKKWSARTHENIKVQLNLQKNQKIDFTNDDFLHDVTNFAWNILEFNVHTSMMMNFLHQLKKKLFMNLINWIKKLIKNVVSTLKVFSKQTLTQKKIINIKIATQLNYRFKSISSVIELRLFSNFNKIKQWIESEQNVIMHQFIVVIISLFISYASNAILCARAMLNFVMLATYCFHDDDTLSYMHHARYRLNLFKNVFVTYRSINKKDENHFNYSKFHFITHFENMIRQYDNVDCFDTKHTKILHKLLIKHYYDLTNKVSDYMNQILIHNTRHVNILIMNDMLRHENFIENETSIANQKVFITHAVDVVNLSHWSWHLSSDDCYQLRLHRKNIHYYRRLKQIAQQFEMNDFDAATIVFVHQQKVKIDKVKIWKSAFKFSSYDYINDEWQKKRFAVDSQFWAKDRDDEWIKNYWIFVHVSVICFKANDQNLSNFEQLIKNMSRCSKTWQRKIDQWRRDHVWFQKFSLEKSHDFVRNQIFNDKSIKKLLLIFTIIDFTRFTEKERQKIYTNVFMNVFKWRNKEKSNDIHEMIELNSWSSNQAAHRRNFDDRRIYDVRSVYRSAHVIFAKMQKEIKFFFNNYLDWNQYNTCYDEDFMTQNIKMT